MRDLQIPSKLLRLQILDKTGPLMLFPSPNGEVNISRLYVLYIDREEILRKDGLCLLGFPSILAGVSGEFRFYLKTAMLCRAKIIRIEPYDDKGNMSKVFVNFTALGRVHTQNIGGASEIVEVLRLEETDIEEEDFWNDTIRERITNLRMQVRQIFKHGGNDMPSVYEYFPKRAEDVPHCIDNFMNTPLFFPGMCFPDRERFFMEMLKEVSVVKRLDIVEEALSALLGFFHGFAELVSQFEEDDPENNGKAVHPKDIGSRVKTAPALAHSRDREVVLPDDEFSPGAKELFDFLRERVVGEGGQLRAIRAIARAYEAHMSPLRELNSPIGTFIHLGASGVGKTMIAKELARFFFGDPEGLTRVDCETNTEGHSVAKLIGSPAGYVGYDDIPLLHQSRVDRHGIQAQIKALSKAIDSAKDPEEVRHYAMLAEALEHELEMVAAGRKAKPARSAESARALPVLSVVLFDEIERAHDNLRNFLLRLIDEGVTQLASGEDVLFFNSFVFLTSNVGSREIASSPPGFSDPRGEKNTTYDIATRELKKIFPPELLGRFRSNGSISVFKALSREELNEILERRIAKFTSLLRGKHRVSLEIDQTVKRFLLEEGSDRPEYGAREILGKFSSKLFDRVSVLMAGGYIGAEDSVRVVFDDKEERLRFIRLEAKDGKRKK